MAVDKWARAMGEPWQRGKLPKESPTTPLGETLPADRGVLGGRSTGEASTSPPWPTGSSAPLHRAPPPRPASGAAGLHAHLLPTLRLPQARAGSGWWSTGGGSARSHPRGWRGDTQPGGFRGRQPWKARCQREGRAAANPAAQRGPPALRSRRGAAGDATQDQNRRSPSEMSRRFGIPSGWAPQTGPIIGSQTNRHAALTAWGSSLSA